MRHVLALADKANGCIYAQLRPTLAPQPGSDTASGAGVGDAEAQLPLPPEMVYGAAHQAADDDIWQSYQVQQVQEWVGRVVLALVQHGWCEWPRRAGRWGDAWVVR